MFVLITVPHAIQRPSRRGRWSDLAALRAANALDDQLRALQVTTKVLVGDVPREYCDLNRAGACRRVTTTFQREYADAVRDAIFVIDVHSFPATTTWRLSFVPLAVILYEPARKSLASDLAAAIGREDVRPVPGEPGTNYIIAEAERHNVPALLLEVNEDEAVEPVVTATARWIRDRIRM